ncbi:hypothetical protein QZH41_015627 [Actinostola sp. cb2023]|nr:hypothetical protein QZH41_015627 [Actinostola sp. cb2023]
MSNLEKGNYTLVGSREDEQEQANIADSKDTDKVVPKSSMWQSVCNLVSDVEGTGLLALPYVVQRGGVVAIAALVIVPFICYYTGKILIYCLYIKDNNDQKIRIRSNYKDMGEASWPRYGGVFVVTMQVVELSLLASLYLVLCGSLLYGILPGVPVPERVWMLIAALVGLPTLFVRHLSYIAWISLLSVIALTIAVFIILGYGATTSPHWDINSIPLLDVEGTPIALAIIIFSYICHPVLPTVEANMIDPKQFNVMLALTYMAVFAIKIVFALFGFLTFSSNIKEVITNSIPSGTVQIVVNSFLVLNVMFSYPFRVITLIHCIEDSVVTEQFRSRFSDISWSITVRVVVNFVTLIPAIAIPHFALMMSFVASLTGMFMVFVLPCTFHLCLESKLRWHDKVLDYFIITFGILAGGIGLVVSVVDMTAAFR